MTPFLPLIRCEMCCGTIDHDVRYCSRCQETVEGYIATDDPPLSPAVAAVARVCAGKFRAAEQADAAARRNAAVAGYCAALLQRQEARR